MAKILKRLFHRHLYVFLGGTGNGKYRLVCEYCGKQKIRKVRFN